MKEFPCALYSRIGAVAADAAKGPERLAGRECLARFLFCRPAPAAIGVLTGEQFGGERFGAVALGRIFTKVMGDDRMKGK